MAYCKDCREDVMLNMAGNCGECNGSNIEQDSSGNGLNRGGGGLGRSM